MTLRRMLALAGISLLLELACIGCSSLTGYGVSPWPLYKTLPAQSELTGAEKTAIAAKLTDDQIARLKALSESEAYYRTIVQEHNKKAIEQRTKMQKTLGTEDADLEALRLNWQARIAPVEK